MTERDPETYEELEILEGMEIAMDSEAPLDEVEDPVLFPVEDEEYGHGALEEVSDVEGFHQPRSE